MATATTGTGRALLLALAATIAAPAALALDESAEAAKRLKDLWSRADDGGREGLLAPVAVAADTVALEAVCDAALERCDWIKFTERRIEEIDKILKEVAEASAKEGYKPDPSKDPKILNAEKDLYPGKVAREEAWLPRLAFAGAAILDALPDRGFEESVTAQVRRALGEHQPRFRDWAAGMFGGSRKVRTLTVLLGYGEEALDEYRKQLKGREKPARELDRVNQEISDILNKYLLEQQKKGDFSAAIPQAVREGLVGGKERVSNALEHEVGMFQMAMEAADVRRLAARAAVGACLVGAEPAVREKMLDLVDKRCLSTKDFELRAFGLRAVAEVPGDRTFAALRAGAGDGDPRVVVPALDSLGYRLEAEAVELLAAALKDPRWQVRASAAAGLGRTGRAAAVPFLVAALKDGDGRFLDDVREALRSLTGKGFPAAADPWERWWAEAGEKFRGPRDPRPEGADAAAAGGGDEAGAPGEGGGSVSFYGIQTNSKRILFVLDFSGSMQFAGSAVEKERKKIDVLRAELKKTLTSLPDGSLFNMIGFANDVRTWKKGAVSRDAKTLKDALKWVDDQPVVGSTNIYDALEQGFRLIGVGAADKNYQPVFDTIFFMTDGTPTSGKVQKTDLILGEIRRWNEGAKIRVHVVGMGGHEKPTAGKPETQTKDLDEKFLRDLAAQNGGDCVIR